MSNDAMFHEKVNFAISFKIAFSSCVYCWFLFIKEYKFATSHWSKLFRLLDLNFSSSDFDPASVKNTKENGFTSLLDLNAGIEN